MNTVTMMISTESSIYGSILAEHAQFPAERTKPSWYLARYIESGKNRENLFAWLTHNQAVPWTPLTIVRKKRADYGYRRSIAPVFPGYFFLKMDFEALSIDTLKRHSVFCDFVTVGHQMQSVSESLIDRLLRTWPDPGLCPGDTDNQSPPALTHKQYALLAGIHGSTRPVSRIAMLMQLLAEDNITSP